MPFKLTLSSSMHMCFPSCNCASMSRFSFHKLSWAQNLTICRFSVPLLYAWVVLVRMYSPASERECCRDEDGGELKERDAELVKELAGPLYDLPKVEYAFAYGSGVFAQPDLQPDRTEEVSFNFKTPNSRGLWAYTRGWMMIFAF